MKVASVSGCQDQGAIQIRARQRGEGKCLDPAVARVPDGSRGSVFEAMLAHIPRSAHEVSPVKMDSACCESRADGLLWSPAKTKNHAQQAGHALARREPAPASQGPSLPQSCCIIRGLSPAKVGGSKRRGLDRVGEGAKRPPPPRDGRAPFSV